MALTDKLTAIADAIREKTGGTEAMTLDQMVTEIAGISAGGNTGGDDGWIGDGNTHIWITLTEGRTSPLLGCCPNGTVTVDWGDGTEPDVLTGTSTSTVKWTPTHNYAKAGDYVITLSVDGKMELTGSGNSFEDSCILRHSSSGDKRNYAYRNAVKKVEIGGDTSVANYAFRKCFALSSVFIPGSVTSIGISAFYYCYSLSSVVISDGVKSIDRYAFQHCYSLSSVFIPGSVTSVGGYAFYNCYSLSSVVISDGVESIADNAFYYCHSLSSVVIPSSVTSIGSSAFTECYSLSSVFIPGSVTSVGGFAFSNCHSVHFCDFTNHTSVPALTGTNAFGNTPPDDLEIRVPAALYDEWIAATNWSAYASQIVAV